MENSIEKDIKNIEEIIELSKEEIGAKAEDIIAILDIEDLISLEHILSSYKKALKENEELKNENDELNKELNEENKRCMMLAVEKQDYLEKYQYHLKQNESLTKEFSDYIPKQKIKDKIEEINKMIAYEHNDAVIIQLGKQKRVLQKLLESEE